MLETFFQARNVEWDINMDEVYEKLDEMTVVNASKALEVPADKYANMTSSERHDYAYDVFRHCPGRLYEFLELPEAVTLASGTKIEPEDIPDYLSDLYGYCIKSLTIWKFNREKDEYEPWDESETFEAKFTVACTAVYHSRLDIPVSLKGNHEGILAYIREHLGDAPVEELEWSSDWDDVESAVTEEDIRDYGDYSRLQNER